VRELPIFDFHVQVGRRARLSWVFDGNVEATWILDKTLPRASCMPIIASYCWVRTMAVDIALASTTSGDLSKI
jgi:hypothetical protein